MLHYHGINIEVLALQQIAMFSVDFLNWMNQFKEIYVDVEVELGTYGLCTYIQLIYWPLGDAVIILKRMIFQTQYTE